VPWTGTRQEQSGVSDVTQLGQDARQTCRQVRVWFRRHVIDGDDHGLDPAGVVQEDEPETA
jgi:hypothetical protein